MAKLKKPLLSLEAKGTLGDSLTFQHRKGIDFVREKPIPAQPRSLAQMYQRWQYQDYIAWWHTLSVAEKAGFRAEGSRYHLTAFAYFMKTQLAGLSDLVVRLHFDEISGAVATDSSKNGNDGVIIGASPVTGRIAGGYHFDGLNDRIAIPSPASICPTTAISFTFFMRLNADRAPGVAPNMQMFSKLNSFRAGWEANQSPLYFWLRMGAVNYAMATTKDVWNGGQIYPIGFTFDGTTWLTYVDGIEDNSSIEAGTIDTNDNELQLGRHGLGFWWGGDLDEFTEHNRCLTALDMLRHSERRYPL